jgi:hypothetical protein
MGIEMNGSQATDDYIRCNDFENETKMNRCIIRVGKEQARSGVFLTGLLGGNGCGRR